MGNRRITDPEVLKGLAQPLRQRLYHLLAQAGPATVSTLAKQVDTDPGLVSYHLRELAKAGYIETAPELARDRRERWYRAAEEHQSWAWTDFTTPEAKAVASAAVAQMVTNQFERVRDFQQNRSAWGGQWNTSAFISNNFLRLTDTELRELEDELHEVINRWREPRKELPAGPGAEDGREHVFLFLHGFPERP
ncbi:winged helix-turn-helix domain-containing protein [Crossiella sp. CA-258035]|uniref:ArsR/SmtB family transcription factor n=1 Tax=Crossiella sp. CA-258035 TaxID=2981138 RepID=UPI0024BC9BAA|nr:winged helix-turn-helix domain-containing protein [Crossiella sp. CA-258035]WHT15658.1 winged helix-turn-helix domain-containing protein [Crossiella sp. CA-258035]